MEATKKPTLRRAITLPHAIAMVVGTIIGASIFVQPSEITGRVPSIPGMLLVWVVAGDTDPKHIDPDPMLQQENNRVTIHTLAEYVKVPSGPSDRGG